MGLLAFMQSKRYINDTLDCIHQIELDTKEHTSLPFGNTVPKHWEQDSQTVGNTVPKCWEQVCFTFSSSYQAPTYLHK